MNLLKPGSILLITLLAQALPAAAVEMFRQPVSPAPFPGEELMSCNELEREIANLLPLTYSYKPGFYENPYQGATLLAGTVFSPAYYFYSAFDYYLDYRESSRILPVQEQLQRLRQQKAEKHCFEN